MNKKTNKLITIRSSTAEYLTFIAATGNQEQAIEMRYEDENIWLTQRLMAELYGVSIPAINQHLDTLTKSSEIDPATIKQYLIVQTEGKRTVQRKVDHYNLQAIISVGFKIENDRAIQFRKWEDWARRLDSFLEFNGNQILTDAGKISHEQAKLHAETQFEKYRVTQDKLFESDFDRFMQLEKVSELRNKKQS